MRLQGFIVLMDIHLCSVAWRAADMFRSTFAQICIATSFAFIQLSLAQQPADTTMHSGAIVTDGGVVSLDLASSDVSFDIPIRTKAGGFNFRLVGHSHAYVAKNVRISEWWSSATKSGFVYGDGNALLLGTADIEAGVGAAIQLSSNCIDGNDVTYEDLAIVLPDGEWHPLPAASKYDAQGCVSLPAVSVATDGSGYTLLAAPNGQPGAIYDKAGNKYSGYPGSAFNYERTDPDGNNIHSSCSGTGSSYHCVYIDMLNTTALTADYYQGANQTPGEQYTYTDSSGATQTYTVTYSPFTRESAFGCSGISEMIVGTIYLPTTVSTPTGGAYKLYYEQTPGAPLNYTTARLAKVVFPTGGFVTYGYSDAAGHHGINCTSAVVPTITRTVNDNDGNTGTWTYVNSNNSSGYSNFTVTETDPASNSIVYNFSGPAVNSQLTYTSNPDFITQVKYGAGTPVKIVLTCYNGNTSSCATPSTFPSLPITQTDVYTNFNSSAATAGSRITTYYDSYNNVTERDAYDFGASNLLSKVVTPMGSWNGSACSAVGNYINDTICYKNVDDSTIRSSEVSSYNGQGHLTSHSISPTANISNPGNLTTTYKYNTNGTVQSITDVNTAITSYAYNGTGGCNNLLPTNVTEPGGLSRSMTWDCNGGVLTSVTDENGNKISWDSYDSVWRPLSFTNASRNASTYGYNDTGSTWTNEYMAFNSGLSATGSGVGYDGLRRPIVFNKQQAPGSTNYDTYPIGYDTKGHVSRIYVPCSSASWTCPTPYATQTYDVADRPLITNDPAGGVITRTYNKQDVLVTVGPLPTNENTKQKQYEYDGLGRLVSVCEITNGTGSASCGQANTTGLNYSTGYVTKYFYDGLSRLTSITQNGQQTRNFTYDGLSRLKSQSNPESGSASYYYDQYYPSGSCWGNGTSGGDLMSIVDGAGSVTCFLHDGLHRVTDAAGWKNNSWSGPCRRFRYDSTSNGLPGISVPGTVTNAGSRLIEAETDPCVPWPPTPITDEWFSYDADGRLTDVWQSTPNAGGYYHSTATYWENGVLKSLSPGITGGQVTLPWQYGVDGEGRMYSSYNSNGSMISQISYDSAGRVTSMVNGTSALDSYGYDNAGRMNSYDFRMGTIHNTGTPTWNLNGTLQKLVIQDAINTADSQTCNYSYDDLARLATVNCQNSGGTNIWNQTFSYDAFGNITKTVPSGGTGISFQPTYTAVTNQIFSLPGAPVCNASTGASVCYDGNGNITNDSFHTYTWDQNWGNPASIDGTNLVYDALGLMVETQNGTTYEQVMYGPTGRVALMNGQTEIKSYQPITTGTYVHQPGSLTNYWRHPDWLGNSRLASSYSGSKYYDTAYAPFGESYVSSGTQDLDFTGQQQDVSTTIGGLYDFPRREYAPRQGRWISPDPTIGALKDPQTLNKYSYLRNNPLGVIDPLGLCGRGGDNSDSACNDNASQLTDLSKLQPVTSQVQVKMFYFGGLSLDGWGSCNCLVLVNRSTAQFWGQAAAPMVGPNIGRDKSDVAMGNWGEAIFHGPGMSRLWNSAYSWGQGAAIGTAAVLLAPAVVQGAAAGFTAVANHLAFGATAGRIFYSGYGAATAALTAAGTYGGTVINTTPIGRVLEFAENGIASFGEDPDILRPAWNVLSDAYASGATGPVLSFQSWAVGSNLFSPVTWATTEYPALLQNGNPIVWMPVGW